MIEINRNNYEAYLLDLAEGELSPANEKQLMLFLDENPDLEVDYDLFELEIITADNIYFENKSDLKKTGILTNLTTSNFDELCIARLEGDLNQKETGEFDKFIYTNEIKQREYNLYKLARFTPDESKRFQQKNSLKKKEAKAFVLRNYYTSISVAASILILFGLYLFISKEREEAIFVSELDQKELVKQIIEDKTDNIKIAKENIDVKSNSQINKLTARTIKIPAEEIGSLKEVKVQREYHQIAYITPLEIVCYFETNINRSIIIDFPINQNQPQEKNKAISFRSFLALNFNKRILKKENKTEVEMFDIAQIGLERVNKWTGSKMSLERIYNENGTLDRTKFNSRILAFSTPAKKDKKLL